MVVYSGKAEVSASPLRRTWQKGNPFLGLILNKIFLILKYVRNAFAFRIFYCGGKGTSVKNRNFLFGGVLL